MIGMDHISQEDKRSSWAGTSRMKKTVVQKNKQNNQQERHHSKWHEKIVKWELFWCFLLFRDKQRNQSLKVHRVCKIKGRNDKYYVFSKLSWCQVSHTCTYYMIKLKIKCVSLPSNLFHTLGKPETQTLWAPHCWQVSGLRILFTLLLPLPISPHWIQHSSERSI